MNTERIDRTRTASLENIREDIVGPRCWKRGSRIGRWFRKTFRRPPIVSVPEYLVRGAMSSWLTNATISYNRAIRHAVRDAEVAMGLAGRRLIAPDPPPRYDNVYFEGMEWLNRL